MTAGLGPKGHKVAIKFIRLSDGVTLGIKSQLWGDEDASRAIQVASAYWSPSGNRILICYSVPGHLTRAVVYRVDSETFEELEMTPPAAILASALNISPILPDDSGYLGIQMGEKQARYFLVKWDGWEHELIPGDHFYRARVQNLITDSSKQVMEKMFFPIPQGRWEESSLIISSIDETHRLDFQKRKIFLSPQSNPESNRIEQILSLNTDNVDWLTHQAARFGTGDLVIFCRTQKGKGTLRVELVNTKTNGRRLLLKGNIYITPAFRLLTPSPDGKHILLTMLQDKQNWLFIITHRGEISGKIELGSYPSPY